MYIIEYLLPATFERKSQYFCKRFKIKMLILYFIKENNFLNKIHAIKILNRKNVVHCLFVKL